MTHEFKTIVESALQAKSNGLKAVLASVVDLDGSSYRKPGVRMLILEDDRMIGAVSGGCVEKDILRESQTVFKTGRSKMMTYDGRYRLGCEGILYILLEEFQIDDNFTEAFESCLANRQPFTMFSYYNRAEGESHGLGTYIEFEKQRYLVSKFDRINASLSIFTQVMPPPF